MNPARQPDDQRGFGILEVMVSIVILAIALLALGRFQGAILQTESTSKSRSVAAQLAQAKIDELRGFTPGSSTLGWTAIGSSSTAESITLSNTTFTRSWTVSTNNDLVYKVLTVTVSWTNPDGSTAQVAQTTAIQDSKAELVVGDGTLKSTTGPTVPYTTGSIPEVIPFDLGDGTKKEVSVPEPTIFKKGSDLKNTLVLFDEVVFAQAGQEAETIERDEFATVNCNCQILPSTSTTPSAGYTPVIQVVNSLGQLEDSVPGQMIEKRAGECSDCSDSQDDTLRELCDTCCRDHHDTSLANGQDTDGDGRIDYFDPFRTRNNTLYPPALSGDHSHFSYEYDSSIPGYKWVAQDDAGDKYLEVCRMKRIDGFWRVMQDWNLIEIKTMPESTLSVSTSTDFTSYISFVTDTVVEYVRKNADNSQGRDYGLPAYQSIPSNSTFSTTWTNEPGVTTTGTEVVMAVNDTKQFMTRGIYVDYIEDIGQYITGSATDAQVLTQVGWHEVNLKPLAQWGTSNVLHASVTDETLLSCDPATDSTCRGLVTAVASSTPDITAEIKRSNSGITNTDPIDEEDGPILDDPARLDIAGTAPASNPVHTGSIIRNGNKNQTNIDLSAIDLKSTSCGSADCCTETAVNPNNVTFSCTMDTKGDGVITVSNLNSCTDCLDNANVTKYDLEVCTTTVQGPTQIGITVANEGKIPDLDNLDETTTLTISANPGADRTWNLVVELDTDNNGCSSDAISNVKRTNQTINAGSSEF